MMLERILEPFLTSFPWWRARPWLLGLLLLLAPAAYLVGKHLQAKSAATSVHRMEGYEQILNRARVTAKALGIPAEKWSTTFRFRSDGEMNRFAQRERTRLPDAVRRILPVAYVRVLMIEDAAAGSKWVDFTYSGEGHLLGYEASPGLFTADAMLANTGTREVAQGALEAVLDPSAFEFGEPAAKTKDGGRGQRFDWSLRAKCCPELAIAATVDVIGPRPSYLGLRTAFQTGYLRRRNTPLNLLADVLRIGFLLGAIAFVGFRFAKRAMEREVPYARALVVWAVLVATGVTFVTLQPFGEVMGEPIFLVGAFRYAAVLFTLLTYVVAGLLLALAYGATEGDLRERFAGRLTSLDALLSGRLWSRNVAVSVLAGAAWGAWAYGLTQWVRAGLAPGFIPLPESELRFSYSAAPWLGLVAANLADSARLAVTVLLVSLSAGIWLCKDHPRWRWVVTSLCSFSAVLISGSPFVDVTAGIMAVSTLATIWLGLRGLDYLAAIAAMVVALGGTSLGDVTAILPAWREPAALARGIGIVTLGLGSIAAYRARRYDDAEVMPSYARNIEERQSRQEEVSATREAQLRLLPLEPPRIPGLGVAAFCAPSQHGVSGDFFDFYPMSRGRLGLLVADGRAGGLGAALTIAMAKGFVQYAAQHDWPAGETLRRLRQAWHRDDGEPGELSLAYAIFDPTRRQIHFARLGTTPVMLAGIDAQDRAAALNGLEADGLAEGVAAMGVGDVVLFYTDGVPHRFAENHRDGLDSWLRNKLRLATGVTADRIAESLRESLRAHEGNAPDDLTAVVVRFEPAGTAALEVSA